MSETMTAADMEGLRHRGVLRVRAAYSVYLWEGSWYWESGQPRWNSPCWARAEAARHEVRGLVWVLSGDSDAFLRRPERAAA